MTLTALDLAIGTIGVCSPSSKSSPPVLLLELVLRAGGFDPPTAAAAVGTVSSQTAAGPTEEVDFKVGVMLRFVYSVYCGGDKHSVLVYCGRTAVGGTTLPLYCGGGGICTLSPPIAK